MNQPEFPDDDNGWIQVAGEVELIGGWAEVSLDERFAAWIDTSAYLVFVTSYGAASVFVQNRRPRSFEVHAIPVLGRRQHATVQCAYQVVARRRVKGATELWGKEAKPMPTNSES